MPSAAQAMAPGAGRTEGDMAKWSPGVVVLGERFVSAPLTPSIAGGGVPAETSWPEGSAVLRAGGESPLTLASVGSCSPVRNEPLLQWMDP